MNCGFYFCLAGVVLSLAALGINSRRQRAAARGDRLTDKTSDADVIKHGLWDEFDGEPMNAYAEEYERRHDLAANPSTGAGQ